MRSPYAFESNAPMPEFSPSRTGYIKINNENYPINHQKTAFSSPQKIEVEKKDNSSKKKIHNLQKALNEKIGIIDRQANDLKEIL